MAQTLEVNNENSPQQDLEKIELQFVKGVGPKRALLLTKLGILTITDLIYHLPRRYEDRTNFVNIKDIEGAEPITVKGRIISVELLPSRSGMNLVKAHLEDETGILELVWFNQKWMRDRLLHKKNEFIFYGTPQASGWGMSITNPEWEEVDDRNDPLSMNRIVPIYPLTDGISQKVMRSVISQVLNAYVPKLTDPLPPDLRSQFHLGGLQKCLMEAHYPTKMEHVQIARRRLVFEEFLILQLGLALKRVEISHDPGLTFDIPDELLERFQKHLPFQLTNAQNRVILEIWADMRLPFPMNRLLQGDVGSGKTVIAAAAIVAAVSNGFQCAMMVPTELLAEQHHKSLEKALNRFGIKPELLVGKLASKQKSKLKERIRSGLASVIVGTHALIQENVEFGRLGLVIIDEQHRFGVMQRATLIQKGLNPDILVMTATPIPRTLTMTLYGDLDVSILDEMPAGRKPIRTKWRQPDERASVYDGIRALIQKGQQVYLICPLVAESEKFLAKAATEMAQHLKNDIFPDLKVGLLHGQMKSEEKDSVITSFRDGEVQLLVATTVVEVGVDVPNATVIVIEDAPRFGLAQLHQLRGRVGRSDIQSYCILIGDARNEDAIRRISTMVETNDGFLIAEVDLELRGPGEFYGTKQSGIPAFKVADLGKDRQRLEEARQAAFDLVKADPKLENPKYSRLKELIQSQRLKMSASALS